MCIEQRLLWHFESSEDQYEWATRMSKNGVFADETAIQIISNLLGRDVIIIMSSPPQNVLEQLEKCPKSVSRSHQFAHVYRVIKSDRLTSSVPLTVLFFEEWNYSAGHYQSISFLQDSWLKEYYSFHLEQDSSRQTGSNSLVQRVEKSASQEDGDPCIGLVEKRGPLCSLGSNPPSPQISSTRTESDTGLVEKRGPLCSLGSNPPSPQISSTRTESDTVTRKRKIREEDESIEEVIGARRKKAAKSNSSTLQSTLHRSRCRASLLQYSNMQ